MICLYMILISILVMALLKLIRFIVRIDGKSNHSILRN